MIQQGEEISPFDATASFDIVLKRATQVIGSQDQALRWMGTPIRALRYATPISLLDDEQGRLSVLSALGRLEHGLA